MIFPRFGKLDFFFGLAAAPSGWVTTTPGTDAARTPAEVWITCVGAACTTCVGGAWITCVGAAWNPGVGVGANQGIGAAGAAGIGATGALGATGATPGIGAALNPGAGAALNPGVGAALNPGVDAGVNLGVGAEVNACCCPLGVCCSCPTGGCVFVAACITPYLGRVLVDPPITRYTPNFLWQFGHTCFTFLQVLKQHGIKQHPITPLKIKTQHITDDRHANTCRTVLLSIGRWINQSLIPLSMHNNYRLKSAFLENNCPYLH